MEAGPSRFVATLMGVRSPPGAIKCNLCRRPDGRTDRQTETRTETIKYFRINETMIAFN